MPVACCLLPVACSLFPTPYSLLPTPYSLFPILQSIDYNFLGWLWQVFQLWTSSTKQRVHLGRML
ncbi:hypothetical protein [Moorena sp. SIOASIH]|uniref:hypothetical protein n=1 Tax=Moorena sp. SIOASIH TaxID=2607817 RepID=UPI0025D057B6|nr:hypothetical protein [Moorena sp. SIOASIH]